MNVIPFDSSEEMMEYLAASRKHALEGLHPIQKAITYGDHWVQFHDIDTKHIIFGYVDTLEQVAYGELVNPDGGLRNEVTWDEVVATVINTDASHQDGLMYGTAYDRFNVTGELGHTHKAHVWPIEERLFLVAAEVDWEIERLGEVGRVLLEIAFRGMRAHLLPDKVFES